ncbi:hypothetical protein U1Q18_010463 [Sarracenia purpurea var. burkii]
MATTLFRIPLCVFVVLILLACLCESSPGIDGLRNIYRTISADGASDRSLLGVRRRNQVVDCNEMALKSKCLQKSNKCRWCRSEALDDMCFSISEAWRLPPQVFSCD